MEGMRRRDERAEQLDVMEAAACRTHSQRKHVLPYKSESTTGSKRTGSKQAETKKNALQAKIDKKTQTSTKEKGTASKSCT